jgi:SAM-dependent methyltransferase
MGEALSDLLLDNFFDMTDDSCIAILPHALRIVAKLGIADHLGDSTVEVEDLAAVAHVNGPALYRLLRALATIGIVDEPTPRCFSLGRLGQRLRLGASASCRWSVENSDSADAWSHADQTLVSGGATFDSVFGQSFFTHKYADSGSQESFAARMSERASNCYGDFVLAADWADSRVVMDIGGNDGHLLEALLLRERHLQGILFDRETVIEAAIKRGHLAAVKDRSRMMAGDFFEGIPQCADTHLMCSILHDWPDNCVAIILRNIRRALPPGGRLLIVEMVVPEGPEWHPSKWSDIGMMVLTGGRERSRSEFERLLAENDFSLTSVLHIPHSHYSLLEATCC